MRIPTVDPLHLREWILDGVKRGPNDLGQIATEVFGKVYPGEQRRPSVYEVPGFISDAVRGVIWELIIQGIVVPGTGLGSGAGSPGLPLFQITEWGKKCLASGEFTPYDTGKYIERLQAKVPAVEPSVILYLTESLNGFRGATYLGSAVMLGVGAETVLLSLRTAVHAALDTQKKQEKFDADTKGRPAKRISDEIRKRLESSMQQISNDLGKEDMTAELNGIFDLIRKTRNEAGHPTGRRVEREEAFALLQLFPSYCEAGYAVIKWLEKQPI
jgi:hypothetical protein